MKKAAIGMVVVLALTLGLALPGESARVSQTGCITRFRHGLSSTGKVTVGVSVGNKWFTFYPTRMKQTLRFWLTPAQLAAWEPMLAELRTAAATKAKVIFYYDDSSKWVRLFYTIFNQPCK